MTKQQAWSYIAGEKGKTRVRVFERPDRRGALYWEWIEVSPTGQRRRVRQPLGHDDQEKAREQADKLAKQFLAGRAAPSPKLTIGEMLDLYLAEKTPAKGESKREHDERAAEMFGRYYGRSRLVKTLDLVDWDRFVSDRLAGRIAPKAVKAGKPVGERVADYDLRFFSAVLRWAVGIKDKKTGRVRLKRNPWQGGRSAGFKFPKSEPRRVIVTSDEYEALRKVAPSIHQDFDALLVVARETGHRGASIRQLRWSDVDFTGRTVFWRKASDKIGFEHTTQLTDAAVAAFAAVRLRRPGEPETFVFPEPGNANAPRSRSTLTKWWRWAEAKAKLPRAKGRGWHSLRRNFATEMKDSPLRDVAYEGGWKNPTTLLQIYQQPDAATQRRAHEQRQPLRKAQA